MHSLVLMQKVGNSQDSDLSEGGSSARRPCEMQPLTIAARLCLISDCLEMGLFVQFTARAKDWNWKCIGKDGNLEALDKNYHPKGRIGDQKIIICSMS